MDIATLEQQYRAIPMRDILAQVVALTEENGRLREACTVALGYILRSDWRGTDARRALMALEHTLTAPPPSGVQEQEAERQRIILHVQIEQNDDPEHPASRSYYVDRWEIRERQDYWKRIGLFRTPEEAGEALDTLTRATPAPPGGAQDSQQDSQNDTP